MRKCPVRPVRTACSAEPTKNWLARIVLRLDIIQGIGLVHARILVREDLSRDSMDVEYSGSPGSPHPIAASLLRVHRSNDGAMRSDQMVRYATR